MTPTPLEPKATCKDCKAVFTKVIGTSECPECEGELVFATTLLDIMRETKQALDESDEAIYAIGRSKLEALISALEQSKEALEICSKEDGEEANFVYQRHIAKQALKSFHKPL